MSYLSKEKSLNIWLELSCPSYRSPWIVKADLSISKQNGDSSNINSLSEVDWWKLSTTLLPPLLSFIFFRLGFLKNPWKWNVRKSLHTDFWLFGFEFHTDIFEKSSKVFCSMKKYAKTSNFLPFRGWQFSWLYRLHYTTSLLLLNY